MRGRPDLAIDLASLTRAPATLTYLQQLAALTQLASPLWLHRIRCPTLVMNGDDDPLMRTVNARIPRGAARQRAPARGSRRRASVPGAASRRDRARRRRIPRRDGEKLTMPDRWLLSDLG